MIFYSSVIHLNLEMSRDKFKKIVLLLSSPKIFIFTILWMMILVVLGTLAQRDLGLYDAQQRYFSCWVTWFGIIPTPGGRTALSVMTFNLMFFMLKPGFWTTKKMGIIITHLGVLLLLLGGGITAWFSTEGNMVIKEGESSNVIVDLFAKELVIINTDNSSYDEITVISDQLLKPGNVIDSDFIPFNLEIIDYYINCKPVRRSEEASLDYKGLAQNFILKRIPNEKETEINRTGMTFEITNSGESSNGIYSLFLAQQIPQTISSNGKEFTLALRRERTYIPFSLKLDDFKKVLHPGTNIAKSYSSDVILIDGDISRPILIQMNEPLRYRNYTFYQSSFNEGPDIDTTILSVVKNYGRLFPYISSLTISLGILVHMFFKFPILFRRKKKENGE